MSEAVIAAIITAVCALVGVVISSRAQSKSFLAELERRSELTDTKLEAKIEQIQAVTNEKLSTLTREVREHNQFAQRIPALEVRIQQLERAVNK